MLIETHCMKYFGERMKELREERSLSQEVLANELGVSKGALCYYENGKRTPDIAFLEKVVKYFDVSADYFLGFSDDKTTDITMQGVCKYTGLSEKSVENLAAAKKNDVCADVLLESSLFEKLILHLNTIERIAIQKRYYQEVIDPIANQDDFYDSLSLNGVKLCEIRCKRTAEHDVEYRRIIDCNHCKRNSELKLDKDYVYRLIRKAFSDIISFAIGSSPIMDCLDGAYQDIIDLEEFKFTKIAAEIISDIKSNADCSDTFEKNNYYVRNKLIRKRDELIKRARTPESVEINKNVEYPYWELDIIEESMAELQALETFLDKYDENFKLKKAGD